MRVPRVGAQHKPVTSEEHEINRAGLAGSCRPGRVGTDRTVPEARGGGSSEARLPRDKLPPPTREPSLWHGLYTGPEDEGGKEPHCRRQCLSAHLGGAEGPVGTKEAA